ncbi:MAG: carboxypeptidase-like regulatory domain-containing protein [Chitinophagaceae bacterium]|nr:carboxypeptidase-like regulatory domain-containing protein [Chitinophagaceae bacterium]
MANDENIRKFTASDIEKYHAGQLSASEMHALEKAALDDPFLADALEGFTVQGVDIQADLAELRSRLEAKTEKAKVIPMHSAGRSSTPWLRIAVMVVIIAGAGWFSYDFLFRTKSVDIAQAPAAIEKPIEPVGTQEETVMNNGSALKSDTATSLPRTSIADEHKVQPTVPDIKQAPVQDQTSATVEYKTLQGEIAAKKVAKENVDNVAGRQSEELKKLKDDVPVTTPPEVVTNADAEKRSRDAAEKNKEGFSEQAVTNRASNNGILNQRNNQFSQPNYFRGQVTDANNNPLPFANITNTNDNVGTYADARGNFTLVSPYDSVMNVQVKALGYENNKLQLRSDLTDNKVTLNEDKSMTAKVIDPVKRNSAKRATDNNMTFEEPEPEAGWPSYDAYLANNLNDIPEAYAVKKNTGSDAVELSFEVNKNGDPVNIRIEKSLCAKCDKEAIRLVKEGPKWKRKARRGTRTVVTVPFVKPN